MNISYNWLKDLIDIDMLPDQLALALTRVGLAVDGVHPHGDDFVLDIDLTSNRPDCLSHLGIAREVRVITNSGLEKYVPTVLASTPDATSTKLVTISDPDLCHRFTGRVISNVKIAPSPKWLVDRLEAIGERAINNVADITNYVMHELGQPMHSFDLDKLAEGRIVVRRARHGESIKTLDEVDRKLDEAMLAICDAERPVAIGGVMGGFETAITERTTNVLLEVAYFKRENIRQTSRKLNLTTEASYRFERGVDIENLVRASDRAAELISELAGGAVADFVDVYPTKLTPNSVGSKNVSAAVKRLTGLGVQDAECRRILEALGISAGDRPEIFVSPSWRHDIAIEEDLVEEVARHTGYEEIADELPPAFGAGEYQVTEAREKALRGTLVGLGFDEAISYSFIDSRFDDMFDVVPGVLEKNDGDRFVSLRDSVIEGAVRMRPSILPGLLDALRLNLNHQRRDVRLFELGKVFGAADNESGTPNEQQIFSLAITGGEVLGERATPVREHDFYDAKGAVESALAAIGFADAEYHNIEVKHLRRGQSAAVSLNGKTVGYMGRLSSSVSAAYKFRSPVFVAEINLETALGITITSAPYQPLAKFPGITRDVSLIAKRNVTFGAIRDAVIGQAIELCRSVAFIDVFEGKGIGEDERSITIRLEYRSDERTLIESEVEPIHGLILKELERELGAKQRF